MPLQITDDSFAHETPGANFNDPGRCQQQASRGGNERLTFGFHHNDAYLLRFVTGDPKVTADDFKFFDFSAN
ncbi:MAG: hypothetical protein R2941_02140 [Desulfobacterales bacterium]